MKSEGVYYSKDKNCKGYRAGAIIVLFTTLGDVENFVCNEI